MLEALADKRLKTWNTILIVAREFYEDSKSYLDTIELLQLQNRVILETPFILNNKVSLFFSVADLIIHPYKITTQKDLAGTP